MIDSNTQNTRKENYLEQIYFVSVRIFFVVYMDKSIIFLLLLMAFKTDKLFQDKQTVLVFFYSFCLMEFRQKLF